MKKCLTLLLAVCLTLGLVACTGGKPAASSPVPSPSPSGEQGQPTSTTEVGLKLGMSISTVLSGSDASEDGNGVAQADSTVVAVLLDQNGVIVDCIIDVAQNKMEFTQEGVVLNKDKQFQTKRELGDSYNMRARSDISKEWYEQAQGFCDYVIGKTAAQVSGIALNEDGTAVDETLRATTTIKIGEFITAVTQACEKAKELGTAVGDKLGLGVYTTMADSTDASEDGDGICFAYSTYCAATVDSEGNVTAAVVDATQSKISVTTQGTISTDLANTTVLSKNDLGDNYGMRARSGLGQEWYEQAAGFCQYITGMKASEIGGIALTDQGVATDETLLATTTIKIGDMITASVKAANDAVAR